jgi:hypothetical protein
MSFANHLQAIYDEQGALTPQIVVDTARDEDHELHGHFLWDDTVAGELYRCNQAAQLIRRVTVKRTAANGDDVVTRAWVSVTEIEGRTVSNDSPGHYLPVEIVISSSDLRPKYEQAMEREWKQLYAKYKEYQEFLDMVAADMAAVA